MYTARSRSGVTTDHARPSNEPRYRASISRRDRRQTSLRWRQAVANGSSGNGSSSPEARVFLTRGPRHDRSHGSPAHRHAAVVPVDLIAHPLPEGERGDQTSPKPGPRSCSRSGWRARRAGRPLVARRPRSSRPRTRPETIGPQPRERVEIVLQAVDLPALYVDLAGARRWEVEGVRVETSLRTRGGAWGARAAASVMDARSARATAAEGVTAANTRADLAAAVGERHVAELSPAAGCPRAAH